MTEIQLQVGTPPTAQPTYGNIVPKGTVTTYKLYSVKEAAEMIGVDEGEVRRLAHEGILPDRQKRVGKPPVFDLEGINSLCGIPG